MEKSTLVVRMDPVHVAYFDPLTNTNFWINDNIKKFNLDEREFNFKGIKNAVKAGVLQIMEGQFPDTTEEKPKKK